MAGHRMSSLPVAQFCGASAALSAKHGAGRAAAMSSAFHALLAGDAAGDRERGRLARLTPEELAEIQTWKRPPDVIPHPTITLPLHLAKHETEHALSKDGYPCDPKDALTVGHSDLLFVVDVESTGPDVGRYAVIVDFKRSTFTTEDGPESLQLLAYGLSAALESHCTHFQVGIWPLTDGDGMEWGPVYETQSFEAAAIWERIREAASSSPTEYATGPHCRRCYGRPHCQEYLLPVSDPAAALAPLSVPGGLTAANAPEVLALYERAKVVMELVKDNLEAFAEREPIRGADGKIWRKVTCANGPSFNGKAFQAEHPELAQKYTSPGKGTRSMGFRWTK